jgi:hypothetical protein
MTAIPPLRIRTANDQPAGGGRYVLYWMIGARRPVSCLEHAVVEARARGLGLVVFEPAAGRLPWASRGSRFVIDGMTDNARRSRWRDLLSYVSAAGDSWTAQALAAEAALVVDDVPASSSRVWSSAPPVCGCART